MILTLTLSWCLTNYILKYNNLIKINWFDVFLPLIIYFIIWCFCLFIVLLNSELSKLKKDIEDMK